MRSFTTVAGLTACVLTGCAAGGRTSSDYVPGPSYHLIMGAIAEQRGVEATAAREYLDSAERSADPEVSQHAAEFAFEYGFDAYALRAARRWAQLSPDDTSAHLHMARLLVRRNEVPAATVEVERALGPAAARSPEDYQLLWDELDQERNAEAVTRVLTRVSVDAPASPALSLTLATAALQSRDFDLAIASAKQALAGEQAQGSAEAGEEDRANEANALIGRALLGRGDTEAALAHMARQVGARPSLDLDLEYVQLLEAADRQSEALARIDDLEKRFGDEPELRRLRALASFESDDYRTAWETFGGLVKDGLYTDESIFYLAEIAAKQQRFDQALVLFARVQEDPYLLPAQEAIARIAEAAGATESAMKVLNDLAERRPDLGFAIARYRATMLQRMSKDDQALQVLTEILRFQPDNANVLLARGALLEKMNQLDAAIRDMRAAVTIMPDDAVALNVLGYTLADRTRSYAEAYRLIRRAFERQPGSGAIMDSYGWVLYRKGKLAEARSYLALAHSLLPDPEVSAHLGEVLWKQGERDAASRIWNEALEKDPDSEPLKETMARFAK